MSKAAKSIQKITRKKKNVNKKARSFKQVDKTNKQEEVLLKSRGGMSLMRKVQRRLDTSVGLDVIAQMPALAAVLKPTTLGRFDYGSSDFGMRLTMPAGLIAATGIRVNDVIELLTGASKGKELLVVAVTDATHLRLEDIATFGSDEASPVVRAELSTVKKGAV